MSTAVAILSNSVLEERNQVPATVCMQEMYNIHKMGLFIVAIGLPCIMDIWEGHKASIGKMLNKFAICVDNMHGYTVSHNNSAISSSVAGP